MKLSQVFLFSITSSALVSAFCPGPVLSSECGSHTTGCTTNSRRSTLPFSGFMSLLARDNVEYQHSRNFTVETPPASS
ncbi:hypothetical protein EV356DRAFT_530432 [Viridothelium virens]|uniref:Secreted protein n=1 Tax=Viridothelium virens TaxID=1048519 RepID=A0A6A6HFP4_VIRVR|nr:hypothetical protein EV356DRAFT_530432 [Viridothelium virens]